MRTLTPVALSLLTLSCTLGAAQHASAETTLDYLTALGATEGGIGSGQPDSAGQTFTVGSDNLLQDFSFNLGSYYGPTEFSLTIASWNGMTVGAPLYQSPVVYSTQYGLGNHVYTFNTGDLALISGQMYAAYLSGSVLPGTTYGQMEMNISYREISGGGSTIIQGTPYSGGYYVYYENGQWTADSSASNDIVTSFRADFTSPAAVAVPEPSSDGLIALAALPLGCALRAGARRRTPMTV